MTEIGQSEHGRHSGRHPGLRPSEYATSGMFLDKHTRRLTILGLEDFPSLLNLGAQC